MTRELFDNALRSLQDRILLMGSKVQEQLRLANTALETLDQGLAHRVVEQDREINRLRFEIEDECFLLIATQAPVSSDLRLIVAAIHMIIDIERMGDQVKGIGRLIPVLANHPSIPRPAELREMGALVDRMFSDTLRAFAEENADLARSVTAQDDAVDQLYALALQATLAQMAQLQDPGDLQACYEILRAARELERFGDLAANVAERSISLVTGNA
ncbi:MAG: phosphate signaling complex protein PhoU [Litorilinea sp.]